MPDIVVHQPAPDALVSYFQSDEVSRALLSVGFNAEEEISILVDMFRNADSPWARLAAHRCLSARLKEALLLSGKVRTLTASIETEQDGVITQLEQQAMRLFDSAFQETNTANKSIQQLVENENARDPSEGAVDAEFHIEGAPGITGDPEKEPALTQGGDDQAALDELDTYRPFAEGHYPPSVRGRAGIASVKGTTLGEKARTEDAIVESVVCDLGSDVDQ